jgi:hypothetical protein
VHVVWENAATGMLWYRKGTFLPAGIQLATSGMDAPFIAPNPVAEGTVVVYRSGTENTQMDWEIADLSGRMAAGGSCRIESGALTLAVPGLSRGSYVLRLNGKEGPKTLRFCVL